MRFPDIQTLPRGAPCPPRGYAGATCGKAAKRFASRSALWQKLRLTMSQLPSAAIAVGRAPCGRPELRAFTAGGGLRLLRALRSAQQLPAGRYLTKYHFSLKGGAALCLITVSALTISVSTMSVF